MESDVKLQVGVKIFLRNKEGKYLLLERSKIKYPNIKNFWDIPGGRIIPGTPMLENIKREVFEETRLQIIDEPKLIGAQDIIRLPEKHIVRLTFVAHSSGTPALDEEHVSFSWLTLDEFLQKEELDEFTREILNRCREQIDLIP